MNLDQTIPRAKGGPTDPTNLGPLHRRHHRGRHDGRWQVSQPEPGTFVWTSPTGHVYTVQLEPLGPIHPRPPEQPGREPDDGPPPF